MEKYSSLQPGFHKRRALSKARRRRRQRRRVAAIACSIAAAGLLLVLAVPSFRHRVDPFADGRAEAKSFDEDGGSGTNVMLPFIRYGRKGWVLSDPAPYESISTCQIDQRRFRCLLKEKEAHGDELQDIARELSFVPR